MVHYTLNQKKLVHIENPNSRIREIFDATDCDVKTSIDNFNSVYDWDKMFDLKKVSRRLGYGHRLFIFYHKDLVVGHCWVNPKYGEQNDIYVYNIFVDKRIHDRTISDSTVYLNIMADKLFSEGFKTLHLDVEDWHKNSQSYCGRAGATTEDFNSDVYP